VNAQGLALRRRRSTQRKVLLVDLDGTLTDPAKGIVGCFRLALEALGRAPPPAAELTRIIGPPLRRSFAELLEGTADPEEALVIYRRYYSSGGLFDAVVYNGVRDALMDLNARGVRLFLCTAKPLVYAERILRHFGLDHYFAGVYGSELDGRLEDKEDLIGHILAERGLHPGECVMWGDRKHDVAAAKRRGIPTIGALWGYGGVQELSEAGAAALCATPADVPAVFACFRRTKRRAKTDAS
jgi:phosphoglycolate phosphatase